MSRVYRLPEQVEPAPFYVVQRSTWTFSLNDLEYPGRRFRTGGERCLRGQCPSPVTPPDLRVVTGRFWSPWRPDRSGPIFYFGPRGRSPTSRSWETPGVKGTIQESLLEGWERPSYVELWSGSPFKNYGPLPVQDLKRTSSSSCTRPVHTPTLNGLSPPTRVLFHDREVSFDLPCISTDETVF